MKVGLANIEEASEISKLVGSLLEEIMNTVGEKSFNFDIAVTTRRLIEAIENENYFVLVAKDDSGVIVGCLTMYMSFALYAEGEFGTIAEFFVSDKNRSKGVGHLLCEEAKKFGVDKGWKRLEVTTPPVEEFSRTLEFYQKEGFAVAGGRKMKVLLKQA